MEKEIFARSLAFVVKLFKDKHNWYHKTLHAILFSLPLALEQCLLNMVYNQLIIAKTGRMRYTLIMSLLNFSYHKVLSYNGVVQVNLQTSFCSIRVKVTWSYFIGLTHYLYMGLVWFDRHYYFILTCGMILSTHSFDLACCTIWHIAPNWLSRIR